MPLEIIQSEEALEDVIKEARYLAKKGGIDLSDRFLEATKTGFKQLAEMPGMGALRDYGNPALVGMRMWPVPGFRNYLIFYLRTEDGLEIQRVLHGAQDLPRIFAPD